MGLLNQLKAHLLDVTEQKQQQRPAVPVKGSSQWCAWWQWWAFTPEGTGLHELSRTRITAREHRDDAICNIGMSWQLPEHDEHCSSR